MPGAVYVEYRDMSHPSSWYQSWSSGFLLSARILFGYNYKMLLAGSRPFQMSIMRTCVINNPCSWCVSEWMCEWPRGDKCHFLSLMSAGGVRAIQNSRARVGLFVNVINFCQLLNSSSRPSERGDCVLRVWASLIGNTLWGPTSLYTPLLACVQPTFYP